MGKGFCPPEQHLITLQTPNREPLLRKIHEGKIEITEPGRRMLQICLLIPRRFPDAKVVRIAVSADSITATIGLTPGPGNSDMNEILEDLLYQSNEEFWLLSGNPQNFWQILVCK